MSTVIKQRNPENPIHGFELLGFNLHPDCSSSFSVPYVNGKYQLGFTTDNQDKKEYFETLLGVTFESKEGLEYLDSFTIDLDHSETILPKTPTNEFIMWLLKVHNGFGVIKMGDKTSGPTDTFLFEFYDEKEKQVERVTRKQIVNEATSTLQEMWSKTRAKVLLVAQFMFEVNSGIDNEIAAYDRLDEYITADPANAQRFIKSLATSVETMDVVVTIKKAMAKNIIRFQNGQYVNATTGTVLGRNLDEIIIFCQNVANQDEYGVDDTSAPYTIKVQLKNSLR